MLDMGSSACSLPFFPAFLQLCFQSSLIYSQLVAGLYLFEGNTSDTEANLNQVLNPSLWRRESGRPPPGSVTTVTPPVRSKDPVVQMQMPLHTFSSCQEKKQFSEGRVDTRDRMSRHPSALYRGLLRNKHSLQTDPVLPFILKVHIFLGLSPSAPTSTPISRSPLFPIPSALV